MTRNDTGTMPASFEQFVTQQKRIVGLDESTAAKVVDKMGGMCRNIKTLFNFDPPATDEEIRAASLQFVRKLSGFNAPSKANEAAFTRAVEEVADVARRLIDSLHTSAPPKDRETEAQRARERSQRRFA